MSSSGERDSPNIVTARAPTERVPGGPFEKKGGPLHKRKGTKVKRIEFCVNFRIREKVVSDKSDWKMRCEDQNSHPLPSPKAALRARRRAEKAS